MPALRHIFNCLVFVLSLTIPITALANLQLTELMPDPVGNDDAEWIELFNSGATPIATDGWTLNVKTRATKLPNRIITPGEYVVFTKTTAGFVLTNTGADILLIDPANQAVTHITYGRAPTGQSYALVNNAWQWVKLPTPGTKNVLPPASAGQTISTSTTKTNYPPVEMMDISSLKSGDRVTVEGTVVAAPGELGNTIAFLNGWQLNFTGDWPILQRGDEIIAQGTVSQTKTYGRRLLLKTASDITIIKHNTEITARYLRVADVNLEHEGTLINTEGRITNQGSNWFDLESNDKLIRVNLKNKENKWPKKYAGNVKVTGLVTRNGGELRLWPRSPEDITTIGIELTQPVNYETIKLTRETAADWRGYIVLAGLTAVLLAGWWYERTGGSQLRKLMKKFFPKF